MKTTFICHFERFCPNFTDILHIQILRHKQKFKQDIKYARHARNDTLSSKTSEETTAKFN